MHMYIYNVIVHTYIYVYVYVYVYIYVYIFMYILIYFLNFIYIYIYSRTDWLTDCLADWLTAFGFRPKRRGFRSPESRFSTPGDAVFDPRRRGLRCVALTKTLATKRTLVIYIGTLLRSFHLFVTRLTNNCNTCQNMTKYV